MSGTSGQGSQEVLNFRFDEVRRQGSMLATAAGLPAARASAFASHLLWFDGAGQASFGISQLPDWLRRFSGGEFEAGAEPKVQTPEHAGTAILDARKVPGPLVLARAAEIAVEKARDVGVAIVRVSGVGPTGPAAEAAAEVAIGPYLAVIIGPRPSWTLALPSAAGLPLVFDSLLVGDAEPAEALREVAGTFWADSLGTWARVLAPGRDWLLLVAAVTAIEPLASFHERVACVQAEPEKSASGWLLPASWEERRRKLREQGLQLPVEVVRQLNEEAARLGVLPLEQASRSH